MIRNDRWVGLASVTGFGINPPAEIGSGTRLPGVGGALGWTWAFPSPHAQVKVRVAKRSIAREPENKALHLQPTPGASDFFAQLEVQGLNALDRTESPPGGLGLSRYRDPSSGEFPIVCGLLYTLAPGLDQCVRETVGEHHDEIHHATGQDCLLLSVEARLAIEGEPGLKPALSQAAEIRLVADTLGVAVTKLPVLILFDPADVADAEGVALRELVPPPHDPERVIRLARAIGTAATDVRDESAHKRLAAFRRALRKRQIEVFPDASTAWKAFTISRPVLRRIAPPLVRALAAAAGIPPSR